MYKCPHTDQHSFGVIHFVGEQGASSYSPEYFAEESEHVELCSSESHASVDIALDLVTGECVRMY